MSFRGRHAKRRYGGNFDQNDGKPGVVYILRNEAFKEDWLKIGQTTKSGSLRAAQLNEDASTGIPKHHVCIFECHTVDCGRAEKEVHARLSAFRTGRQEFFTVAHELAKATISEVCQEIDERVRRERLAHETEERLTREREYRLEEKVRARAERLAQAAMAQPPAPPPRQEIRLQPAAEARRPFIVTEPPFVPPATKSNGVAWTAITVLGVFLAVSVLQPSKVQHSANPPQSAQVISHTPAPAPAPDPIPAPPSYVSPSLPAPTPLRPRIQQVPEKARVDQLAKRDTVSADVQNIAERAMKDYPFLNTPAGAEVLAKITARRDALIAQGMYPSIALTQAVNAFAPAYSPAPRLAMPVVPLVEPAEPPGRCRWITPTQLTCP